MNDTQNTIEATQANQETQTESKPLTDIQRWNKMMADSPWPHLRESATRAFYNTSHSPERGGAFLLAGYAECLELDIKALEKYAATTEEIAEFKTKFEFKLREVIHAKSRCISSFITGGSNFPVSRAEKANAAERKRVDDFEKWRKSFINRHRKAFNRENAPESSDYRKKVEELTAKQEMMKAVNKIIRSKKDQAEKARLVAEAMKVSEAVALEFITTPDCFGCIGFPHYKLTNNLAKIKAAEAMAKKMEARETTPDSEEVEIAEGVKVSEHPAENRIRIFFPGKPSDTMRQALKSQGFRWSPRNEAWQAYLASGREKLNRWGLKEAIIAEYGEPLNS